VTDISTEPSFLEARGLKPAQKSEHKGPKWAAALVRKGCHVHPLKLGSKAPATEAGLKDAKQDASDIRGNYGVVAGRSGLVIVDLDDYVPGNAVEQFIADFELTPTFSVRTGSGGRSWWYRAPEGSDFTNKQNVAGYRGVDIKAGEGYALGPGCALHKDEIKKGSVGDGTYSWIAGEQDFAQLPPKLAAKLTELSAPRVIKVDVPDKVDASPAWVEATLNGIAGDLRAAQSWPEGHTEPGPNGDERGWDKLCADAALSLAGMAFDGMITMDQAREVYRDNAPIDDGFDPMSKWAHNAGKAKQNPGMRKRPKEQIDLLAGVEDRSRGKASAGDDASPDGDPSKPEYELTNGPEDSAWLLQELGTNGLAGFFLRDGRLVYTARVDSEGYIPPMDKRDLNGPATIQAANWEKVAAKVDHHYHVYKTKSDDKGNSWEVPSYFPDVAAKRAYANIDTSLGLRQLHGVTHTPIIRSDGSVLGEAGYDDRTGLLYLPDVDVELPDDDHILPAVPAARDRIRAMVSEFSWTGPNDEANYLGLLLTPLLRELCPPPYKLAAIGARERGSGKSLLARIMRDVHGGVFRADLPPTEEEMGKSIAGILTQTTAPVVQFDNVDKTLRSAILTALLTSASYSGRLLGSTNSVSMSNDRLWVVTGNNISLGGDLTRRTMAVTIDPGVPNPEERTGFKLNIPEYVASNRGQILADLLVLIRGWVLAGSPTEAASSSDDYAHWTTTVRGILEHAGIEGRFDGTRLESSNEDDVEWAGFLGMAHEVMGEARWTMGDLLAKGDATPEAYQQILAALPERVHDKAMRTNLRATAKSLGRLASARDGRHVLGYVMKSAGEIRKQKTWQVERYAQ
jgi:hypothetical protein